MTVFVKSIENSRIHRDTSRRSLQPDTTDVARGARAAARAKTADYARPRERAAGPLAAVHLAARRCASRATFLTRPSTDKFQAGRHHPYMGEFERVNRLLFDRRMPFLHLVVSHRAPRSR